MTKQRMQEHKIENVKVVKNIEDLPECSQYILSLPNNYAVKQVVDKISKLASSKVLVIDTSTVSP